MATQREVAERAGVSFITVSRVINGRGNVKEETRLRIQRAIEELGYYPNSQGRALNSGKTSIVGVVAPVLGSTSLEGDLYYSGLLEGVELACRKHHYDMLLSTQRIGDRDFDYLRLYSQKKVDGTILFGDYQLSEETTARIERERIPMAVVGDRPASSAISWVDTDNETAGYRSALKLVSMGHSRLAFIGVDRRNTNIEGRLAGVRRALRENGLSIRDENIFTVDQRNDYSKSIIETLLSRADRPTAVVCGTDVMAIGLMKAAQQRSLDVPRDFSLVGFDGIQMVRFTNPPLCSYRQPLADMGSAAMEMLRRHIEDPAAPSEQRIFPLEEVEGGSIAPPGAASPP